MSDSSRKGVPARPETPVVDDMAWLDMEAPAGVETPDRTTADDGRPIFAGTGILARNTGLFTDPLDRRQQVERLEDKSSSHAQRRTVSVEVAGLEHDYISPMQYTNLVFPLHSSVPGSVESDDHDAEIVRRVSSHCKVK